MPPRHPRLQSEPALPAALRQLLLALAAMLVACACARAGPAPPATRSEPSTELTSEEQDFGGVIGARAMFWMTNDGNLIEAMNWYREAGTVSLSRLDLYRNFSNITALDLQIRNPSDVDLGYGLSLRSLPYFTTEHRFTDSTFFNLGLPFPNQRQRFWGDVKVRKFAQVPFSVSYDVNALRGIGPNRDRSWYDEHYAFQSHTHFPGLDLDIELPVFVFTDRHDNTNDTKTQSAALSLSRPILDGDGDLQATYRRSVSHLDLLDRYASADLYEFRGLLYRIFGVDGFKLETRGRYRTTPDDLALTARTDSVLDYRAVLSLTQGSGYSVQLGREHRKVRRERLLRAGYDRLGLSAALTRGDLTPFRVTDEPRYDDVFGRFFFRFRPWASATYYHKETSMEDQPPTDLVRSNSQTLLFDRQQDKRIDFQLNPLHNIGLNLRLWQQRNNNLGRFYGEIVRSKQADGYWLLVNDRLNLGATFAVLEILPSRGDVLPGQADAFTRGGSVSYQVSPELRLFTDYTQIDTDGPFEDTERITNIGLEAETGTRHRLTWRAAYTIDARLSEVPSSTDFDVRGVNISGEAEF